MISIVDTSWTALNSRHGPGKPSVTMYDTILCWPTIKCGQGMAHFLVCQQSNVDKVSYNIVLAHNQL